MITYISDKDITTKNKFVNSISNAIYETTEDAEFNDAFVPVQARPPQNQTTNFSRFLLNGTKALWSIHTSSEKNEDDIIGFILIADLPHKNAIGFGLKKEFSNRGIMKKACKEVLASENVIFPINAYTAAINESSIKLLSHLDFEEIERKSFHSMEIIHFQLDK